MLGLKTIAPLVIFIILIIGGVVILNSKSNANKPRLVIKTTKQTTAAKYSVRYLPLGDSYTIGQSEPEADNFPNQLVNKLRDQGVSIGIVANPSVTGYTTKDLIDYELPLVPKLKPTFVTVLIGVNDYVQGVSIQTFQTNLNYIINYLQKQLPNPGNILLITIPDFSKTPTGAEFGNPATLEAGVEAFNTVIKNTASSYKLPLADIFPVSQGVANNSALIASDGLHPSPQEYSLWVTVINQVIQQNLHL
jgi:lysophospholipase L1-like esterase